VTQIVADSPLIPKFRPGLPVRIALLAAAFFAEKVFLNGFVDFDAAQGAQGLGAVLRVAQHWGFRFLVAFAAAVALFAYVRSSKGLQAAAASVQSAPVRWRWMIGHFLLAAMLAPLSYLLYRRTVTNLSFAAVVAAWMVLGAAAVLAAMLAMSPWAQWRRVGRELGSIWCYAAMAALVGTGAMQLAQSLWTPTAALTFDLVRRVLAPVIPALRADPATLILSTDRFAVQIADACSGLEGVGLILAFSAAWLLYFRREYIFPRALALIPAGMVTIFALNILRIAALILIGNWGFPTAAVYGFHSQAGWVTFIAVACGMVLFSRRSAWLNRTAARSDVSLPTHNPTAAYLMPLLTILAAGVVSHVISSDFDLFYCLRPIAGLLALALYRRKLGSIDWTFSWRGPAVGAVVFLIWIVAAHFLLSARPMPESLAMLSPALRDSWVAGRIAGSIIIVPLAEELAYRGFLLRRLIDPDFESIPYRAVRWPALAVTAVVFGMAHGALWLPGIVAGFAFGLILMRRGRLGEAFAAHATANALIAAFVLGGGQWQLW
jgi:exosortase E/protease (VPEID-CTERM system)